MIAARPKRAATCLVLRDGHHGLEVLMVERNRSIVFGGGALVFPGGKLDLGDLHKVTARYTKSERHTSKMMRALAVAAVREIFEETGLLLTRSKKSLKQVGEPCRAKLAQRWRMRLATDKCEMDRFLNVTKHFIDLSDLGYFARWITPIGSVKRYDTHFFLSKAPKRQVASHDGHELVSARWVAPQMALELERQGEVTLMFPTRMNLKRLLEVPSVAHAFTLTRSESVIPVLPRIEQREGRVFARIPTNAGYGRAGLYDRQAL